MATDALVLGGIAFDDWSTPSRMPFGGKQALAIHKLPGGSRVVDELGPDEMDIAFTGTLWGDGSFDNGVALDALRSGGQIVPLMYCGQFYQVIVQECSVIVERFPQYAAYNVSCLVVSNPMAGGLGAIVSTVGSLVSADLATVASLAGL